MRLLFTDLVANVIEAYKASDRPDALRLGAPSPTAAETIAELNATENIQDLHTILHQDGFTSEDAYEFMLEAVIGQPPENYNTKRQFMAQLAEMISEYVEAKPPKGMVRYLSVLDFATYLLENCAEEEDNEEGGYPDEYTA